MNKSIFGYLVILLFFISCNQQKYKNADRFSFSDIPEKKHLAGEIIELEDVFRPIKIYLKDSIFFIVNQGQEYFINTYNLNKSEKIGEFVPFGSGPDEISYLDEFQFVDSLVWIFDRMKQQLLKYNFSQFLKEGHIKPHEKIRLNDICENALVTDSKLLTYSFSHPEARFSTYNLQGQFVEKTGDLPDPGVSLSTLEMYESYFCNMALNPSDKSIFIAYKNTDLIEVYDNEGVLKTRKHGPEHFFSIKKETNQNETISVRSIEGKTRDAYFSPVAFEDEIWTVYDGKYFDRTDENSFLCNHIIVFDWDGNPIRQYITDIPFYSLAVDRINNIIYGVTLNPEFSIVKFTYHLKSARNLSVASTNRFKSAALLSSPHSP